METEINLDEVLSALLKDINSFDEYLATKRYSDREIYLGDIDSGSAGMVVSQIITYNKEDEKNNIPVENRKPILIYLNSLGGSVIDGYAIMDVIELSKTPVYTIAIGSIYSMGACIFLTGHTRIMYPRSTIMFHDGNTQVVGSSRKVKDTVDFFNRIAANDKEYILKRTDITEELYDNKQSDEWYLTAPECLQLKIADKIADSII